MPDANPDQVSPEGAEQHRKDKKEKKEKKEKREKKKHKKDKKEKKSKREANDSMGSSDEDTGLTKEEQQRIEDELRQKALLSTRRRESSDD